MNVTELSNLWIGYNKAEDFRVLICALDKKEAQEISDDYLLETHMAGIFEITEFDDSAIRFDCDYVLTRVF